NTLSNTSLVSIVTASSLIFHPSSFRHSQCLWRQAPPLYDYFPCPLCDVGLSSKRRLYLLPLAPPCLHRFHFISNPTSLQDNSQPPLQPPLAKQPTQWLPQFRPSS